MSIEQSNCIRRFMRICGDGWEQGWHENNGGNLSYRMDPEDVAVCLPYMDDKPGLWVPTGVKTENLAGEMFIVTGKGKYMRKVNLDMADCIGIIEINETGDCYRKLWGLCANGEPTSELPTHLMAHSARMVATNGADRVVYHTHCPNLIALTLIAPAESRTITRILWKSMSEGITLFPDGVGALPWMLPGSTDLAVATGELMEVFGAVLWANHGLVCTGATFDETFGLTHTLEKTAEVYLTARSAAGGKEPSRQISDAQLRETNQAYGLAVSEDFLG